MENEDDRNDGKEEKDINKVVQMNAEEILSAVNEFSFDTLF